MEETGAAGGPEQAGQEAGQGGRGIPIPIPIPGIPREMPPGRLLWYGGLAALAALDVIEWPVAAVAAVGTYIARRQMGSRQMGSTSADRSTGGMGGMVG
jgi:hypothetical protein